MSKRRDWLFDGLIGAVIGGITGAIVAVNLIITVGIGYDVTLGEVFRQNTFVGIVTVVILGGGPVVGVMVMRRLRRQRSGAGRAGLRQG